MTLFCTREGVRPDLPIYSQRLGRTIRFEEGRLETDDPAVIAVLRSSRYVYDFTRDVEEPLSEPSPLDNPLGWSSPTAGYATGGNVSAPAPTPVREGEAIIPPPVLPEREAGPDRGPLPPLPDDAYPPGAKPLDDDDDQPPAD